MRTNNPEETILFAERLAKKLKKGDVVALSGNLGSGKTTFTKGIGKGLGVKEARRINSPTFVIIREYQGNMPLYHIDLYRLDGIKDVEGLGIEEYIYGDGVTVIEWPEKIKCLLPKRHILVKFRIKGENDREISVYH